jgi:hypothetical protein
LGRRRVIILGVTQYLGSKISSLENSKAIEVIDEKILKTLTVFWGLGMEKARE